jgi:hypothetical protein
MTTILPYYKYKLPNVVEVNDTDFIIDVVISQKGDML